MKEDFEHVIHRQTGARGVDLVLDSIGGASWKKAFRLLAPMGRLGVLGFSDVSRGCTMYSKLRAITGLLKAPSWRPLQLLEQPVRFRRRDARHVAKRLPARKRDEASDERLTTARQRNRI